MMVSRTLAPIEADHKPVATLESLRQASERWVRRERARVRIPAGVETVDALLGGGWPQGKVGELVGPVSSGRSSTAMATVAAATVRGEVVAWIDAANAFDPASAAAVGVDLARVLWVRPHGVEKAVRAAELVLETGGFTVVVMDLGAGMASARQRGTGGKTALGLRLARAVERASAVALVVAERPWVGALAGATVALGRGQARWKGGKRGGPRWLAGITLRAHMERGAIREVGGSTKWAPGRQRQAVGA